MSDVILAFSRVVPGFWPMASYVIVAVPPAAGGDVSMWYASPLAGTEPRFTPLDPSRFSAPVFRPAGSPEPVIESYSKLWNSASVWIQIWKVCFSPVLNTGTSSHSRTIQLSTSSDTSAAYSRPPSVAPGFMSVQNGARTLFGTTGSGNVWGTKSMVVSSPMIAYPLDTSETTS